MQFIYQSLYNVKHYTYMSVCMSNQKLISQQFNSIDLFSSQFHWFAMNVSFDAVHISVTVTDVQCQTLYLHVYV